MRDLPLILVVAIALAQIAFAVVAWAAREPSERFVLAFASSARAHFTEQGLPLLAGTTFMYFAPEMRWPWFFKIFGWVLIVTSVFSLVALWLGGFVLWAVFSASG